MRLIFLACIFLLSVTLARPPPSRPRNRRVDSRVSHGLSSRNSFSLNVLDFGAVGDGSADNTGPFQAALNKYMHEVVPYRISASSAGGGIVVVPSGQFRFDGVLTVPHAVTLEGVYTTVPAHSVGEDPNDKPNDGSVLLPYGGRGSEAGAAFITLTEDSTLRGFTIYYPEQLASQHPTPYPYAIAMTENNAAVTDVECLNCFNAISAVRAHRHYIARVQGQPINIGIFIDEIYDIGRVEDVHFNPWFSQVKDFMRHQLTLGRAFVIARTDWEYMTNCFAFGYNIGYHFVQSGAGACNGNFLVSLRVALALTPQGIGADMATNASVRVDAADPWGIEITNGEFTAFVSPDWIDPASAPFDPTEVVVGAANIGAVRFVNSAFWGPANRIAALEGSGTVGFSDCTFQFDNGGGGT